MSDKSYGSYEGVNAEIGKAMDATLSVEDVTKVELQSIEHVDDHEGNIRWANVEISFTVRGSGDDE